MKGVQEGRIEGDTCAVCKEHVVCTAEQPVSVSKRTCKTKNRQGVEHRQVGKGQLYLKNPKGIMTM